VLERNQEIYEIGDATATIYRKKGATKISASVDFADGTRALALSRFPSWDAAKLWAERTAQEGQG
jgi:hypothetical protein